jgi:hypothetical protein
MLLTKQSAVFRMKSNMNNGFELEPHRHRSVTEIAAVSPIESGLIDSSPPEPEKEKTPEINISPAIDSPVV